jgi:hypothetical protein
MTVAERSTTACGPAARWSVSFLRFHRRRGGNVDRTMGNSACRFSLSRVMQPLVYRRWRTRAVPVVLPAVGVISLRFLYSAASHRTSGISRCVVLFAISPLIRVSRPPSNTNRPHEQTDREQRKRWFLLAPAWCGCYQWRRSWGAAGAQIPASWSRFRHTAHLSFAGAGTRTAAASPRRPLPRVTRSPMAIPSRFDRRIFRRHHRRLDQQ